jgi:hypothetical protein
MGSQHMEFDLQPYQTGQVLITVSAFHMKQKPAKMIKDILFLGIILEFVLHFNAGKYRIHHILSSFFFSDRKLHRFNITENTAKSFCFFTKLFFRKNAKVVVLLYQIHLLYAQFLNCLGINVRLG